MSKLSPSSIFCSYRANAVLNQKIWRMAWPPMISNITTPLLGLVDTAVVGHLGTATHLAAVAIGASIFSFLFWAFGFLRMGSTGLTAQALGQGDERRVRELLLQSILMGVFIGLILILFRAPLIDLAITLMEPSAEVEPWARLYCEARIFSAPAVLAGYALMGWFFGVQYSKGPLWMLLVINVANMILDYFAVYGLGMASDGVAWATVFAHYIGVTVAGVLAWHKLKGFSGHVPLRVLAKWREYMALVQVNRYLFVRTILLLLVMLFFTAQGARQGDSILAANAVLLTFLMIISNALDGFAWQSNNRLTDQCAKCSRRCGSVPTLAHLLPSVGYLVLYVGWCFHWHNQRETNAKHHDCLRGWRVLPCMVYHSRPWQPWFMAEPSHVVYFQSHHFILVLSAKYEKRCLVREFITPITSCKGFC